MLIFGATDNFKKNTYPYKFRSLTDGGKWRWRADDLDTIFDINNQGLAAKIYSILVGDKTSTGSGSIYRGDNSAFWTLIKETQQSAIKAMVHKIFNAMVAHPKAVGSTTIDKLVGFIKYFFWDFAQAYFTASAYNADTEWTYEDIWANKNTWKEVNPLSQALGGHYEAEQDWVAMRMLFLASYYNYGPFVASGYKDASTGQMVYGGAEAHTYEFTPSIDFNPTIIRGSTETITYGDRVKANTVARLTVSSSSGADTRVYVQGLDWIKDIGDLSTLTVSADNPTLNVASQRLQRLKIGDVDASTIPSAGTIKSLTLGDCPSMMSIDARNLSTLEGTIDLSNLDRLREAYFGGTNIKGVNLQDGSKIEVLELTASITSLKLVRLKNVSLNIESLSNVSDLRIENCEGVDGFELMKEAYFSDNSQLSSIRLIGFEREADANDLTMLANMVNDVNALKEPHTFTGIDAEGRVTDHPVIEGTLIINTPIYREDEEVLKNAYGDALIIVANNGYYIQFEDDNVRDICAYNWGDGTGITEAQVASVTSLGGKFKGNTLITEFDELEKFTGVASLGQHDTVGGYGDFQSCTNLLHIKLPKSVKILKPEAFYGCTSLTSVGDLSNITKVSYNVFRDCALRGDIYMPNLTGNVPEGVFRNSGIDTVSSLGSVTNIGGSNQENGAFRDCKNLSKVVLPPTVTYLGTGAFENCSSLKEINLESLVTISSYAFYDCNSLEIEDLSMPNLESLGSSAFYNVAIKNISNLGKLTSIPQPQNYGGRPNFSTTALQSINFPDTLVSIGSYAFVDYSNLVIKDLNLPNLTSIGNYAFQGTPISGDLNLPNLTSIGSQSFTKTNIESITSLGNITTIPGGNDWGGTLNSRLGVFFKCLNLKKVILPETLTTISDASFDGCTALTELRLGNSIQNIGKGAFESVPAQIEISLPNLTSLGRGAFRRSGVTRILNLGSITSLEGTDNWNNYGEFESCPNLELVILSEMITNIGGYVFRWCSKLDTFICKATTPPTLGSKGFEGSLIASGKGSIYVPDDGTGTIVQAYKTATNWSTYASRIFPISQLATDNPELYAEIEEYL